MQVIGLTGGIASGKSTVSAMLKKAGAIVIDADRIARAVVKKGLPAYREIVAQFGTEILLPDGEINRNMLGDIIFKDHQKKMLLNSIVHPHVDKEVNGQIKKIQKTHPHALIVLDVPLLIEAGMHNNLSEIIVVYTPQDIQIQRLMQRDHISEADAHARVQSQIPIEEKKQQATIVIDNSGTIENTRRQTLNIFKRLKDRR
ncbi:MAG: dephospho-CoA kinase [Deltaproteobacteria bacterium]|nr:dephospho-CoA kinase [Deltaproteobacteria bacterium]